MQKEIKFIAPLFLFWGLLETTLLPKDQSNNYSSQYLDSLMAGVWKNSEVNFELLREYVFREKEVWVNKAKMLPFIRSTPPRHLLRVIT